MATATDHPRRVEEWPKDIRMHDGPIRDVTGTELGGDARLHERPAAILVAVPLYRSPELLPALTDSLLEMAVELKQIDATILLVNDSPDDDGLIAALDIACARLRGSLAVEVLTNTRNLGFIASANRALEAGLATDRDVILLNSDALPRPGAFAEMLAVAYLDPLISVVSPRSDNATICNSPVADTLRKPGEEAYRAHELIARHLPRVTYVPTAVGFCLLVKRLMLAEFGFLDPVYGAGYNEENDFIRRCNQRGYRAVLANRAYVHHIGEISFSKTDTMRAERDRENHAILIARYPEYDRTVQRHFAGADHRAEHVLGGLVPVDGRLGILFDCRVMGPFFNGTFEHIRCLLHAFARQFANRYELRILCDRRAYCFHQLREIDGLQHWSEEEARQRPSAVVFRMSQPDAIAMASLAAFGAVTGAFMLDTIAMDCQQLDTHDLHDLWSLAAAELDLIGFNSAFSRDQFVRRFEIPDRTVNFVSSCSTDPADYPAVPVGTSSGGGGILLIGNHFPHKHVREMARALHAVGVTMPVTCFGVTLDEPGVEASYSAGDVPEDVVDRLYDEADLVLFPSHYEGFGLPIMHALARRLPVIARDIPCAREIKARCPAARNLHLGASTGEMAQMALSPPRWEEGPADPDRPMIDWNAAAALLADAFEEGIARFAFAACRRHQAAALSFVAATQAKAASVTVIRVPQARGRVRKGFLARLYDTVTGRAIALRRRERRQREKIRALVQTPQNKAEGLFDAEWYLEKYPDVRASGSDPVIHYIRQGAWEDRDPGPRFRSTFYLITYPDVASSGQNPLLHYLQDGRTEGRMPNPGY